MTMPPQALETVPQVTPSIPQPCGVQQVWLGKQTWPAVHPTAGLEVHCTQLPAPSQTCISGGQLGSLMPAPTGGLLATPPEQDVIGARFAVDDRIEVRR